MSFINNLPEFSANNIENNERKITLADIVKCKGSGSSATRFIGQIQTAWKTGRFVTDKAVAEFIKDHFDNLNALTEEFKNLTHPIAPNLEIDAKQLKKDQGIALRLAKVFANVSQREHLDEFGSNMRTTHVVLKALKAMDKYDPADLIRAAVFERNGGFKTSNDLKQQFSAFVSGRNINNEEELNEAFQDFKNEISDKSYAGEEAALAGMRAYPKDKSTRAYLLSGHEDLGLEAKEFNKVHDMAIPELMKALTGELVIPEAEDEQIAIVKAKGIAAMNRYDPLELIKAAVYDKMKGEELKDDLKSHFGKYVIGKEIKDEGGLMTAYLQYQNEMAEAVADGDPSALEKMQKYPKDKSLEKFNSKFEQFKSSMANRGNSESAEFEEMEGIESSSLISEVKEMGVEELLANLSWGTII